MCWRQVPPVWQFRSTDTVSYSGPQLQRFAIEGSLQARNTLATGALNVRRMTTVAPGAAVAVMGHSLAEVVSASRVSRASKRWCQNRRQRAIHSTELLKRSEERRVGKEGRSR